MKIAKLYIKGIKDPIQLTEEQGVKAEEIKNGSGQYATMKDSAVVSIADIWTGEKGDIRYIVFEKLVNSGIGNGIEYTTSELIEFEEELSSYLTKNGGEDFVKWVEKLLNLTIDLDAKLYLGEEINNRLLGIRERNGKTKEELEKNREKIREEITGIGDDFIVGTLSKKNELKYLVDKKAIRMNEDGNGYTVLEWDEGTIPFAELSRWLQQWRNWKYKKEYANKKTLEQYGEMSNELEGDLEMNEDFGQDKLEENETKQ